MRNPSHFKLANTVYANPSPKREPRAARTGAVASLTSAVAAIAAAPAYAETQERSARVDTAGPTPERPPLVAAPVEPAGPPAIVWLKDKEGYSAPWDGRPGTRRKLALRCAAGVDKETFHLAESIVFAKIRGHKIGEVYSAYSLITHLLDQPVDELKKTLEQAEFDAESTHGRDRMAVLRESESVLYELKPIFAAIVDDAPTPAPRSIKAAAVDLIAELGHAKTGLQNQLLLKEQAERDAARSNSDAEYWQKTARQAQAQLVDSGLLIDESYATEPSKKPAPALPVGPAEGAAERVGDVASLHEKIYDLKLEVANARDELADSQLNVAMNDRDIAIWKSALSDQVGRPIEDNEDFLPAFNELVAKVQEKTETSAAVELREVKTILAGVISPEATSMPGWFTNEGSIKAAVLALIAQLGEPLHRDRVVAPRLAEVEKEFCTKEQIIALEAKRMHEA